MLREIIRIDAEKCNGCELCIPNCPEGAIQIIDGKARLISDLFCDGLGACIGHCPEGAITIEKREAQAYDERQVMQNIITLGPNVIRAHLEHLRDHGEMAFLKEAITVLNENNIPIPENIMEHKTHEHAGCPGAQSKTFNNHSEHAETENGKRVSHLTHWPIQLHLLSPMTVHYQNADLLLSADCVPFAMADFHRDHLKGKTLAIACPKLDDNQEIYSEKLTALIDEAKVNTITVMIMQVPCCHGLLRLAQEAAASATRKVPIKCIVVALNGDVLSEEWAAA